MATKAKSSVFKHFSIAEKVEGNFKAKYNYCPATLSQIQLCLLYISRFSIAVWKAVEMKNVFVFEILFKVFVFKYFGGKSICICIFERINVFVFVLKYISMYLTPVT